MAKHRDDERIRVIAIGDEQPDERDGSDLLEPGSPESRKSAGRKPLIALIATLGIAIGLIAAFGGIGPQESVSEPLSIDRFTPASATQSSAEFHLLVSAASNDEGWSVVWDSSDDPIALGAIGAIPNRSREFAHFTTLDSSGELQASRQCSAGECRIRLVRADDPSLLLVRLDAPTYAWHSSLPNAIAWLDRANGFVTTARIDPELGRLIDQNQVAPTEGDLSLVQWDDAGFVLSGDRTIALANDGSTLWSFDGWTLDASLATVTVTDGVRWLVVDRQSGEEVVVVSPDEGLLEIVGGAPGEWQPDMTDAGYTFSIAVGSARTDGTGLQQTTRRLPTEAVAGAEYRVFRSTSEDTVVIVYETPTEVG